MNPSGLVHQRALFDNNSLLGVVETGINGDVRYANNRAMEMLGVYSYEGTHLASFYEDAGVLRHQLEERQAGVIGNYRAVLRRASDGTKMAVQVTAIPTTDELGRVSGSFAVIRLPLEEEINRLHQEIYEADKVLYLIIRELEKAIPFDLVTASRFSSDLAHLQTFLLYTRNPVEKIEWRKQWESVPKPLVLKIGEKGTSLYTNLEEQLAADALGSLRQTPVVQELVKQRVQTCIRLPILRKNELYAAVTFYSRKTDGLTEEHRRLIETLPIATSVIHTIQYFDQKRDNERHALLTKIAHCSTINGLYDVLAIGLCEIFKWPRVTIYRVDHAKKRLSAVSTYQQKATKRKIKKLPGQSILDGVLGRVVRDRKSQAVADVGNDPNYFPNDGLGGVQSVLCVPVFDTAISERGADANEPTDLEGRKVRWVIEAEETRPDAFSDEEKFWLEEVANEVSGFMQKLRTLHFLFECMNSASDAMIVIDANKCIRASNVAAINLFGQELNRLEFSALFSEADTKQIDELPSGYLGEYESIVGKGKQLSVSKKSLPDDIGGALFTLRDLRLVRRALELELLEQTAYEVALEARTPLMLALSFLERLPARDEDGWRQSVERTRQYLLRVNHAYTKLATFNTSVQAKSGATRVIDLNLEAETIASSLPIELQKLIHLHTVEPNTKIDANPFEIAFVLETVLMFFVRSCPEDTHVSVTVTRPRLFARCIIEGIVPSRDEEQGALAPSRALETELRLAGPIVDRFIRKNRGRWHFVNRREGGARFSFLFPLVAR